MFNTAVTYSIIPKSFGDKCAIRHLKLVPLIGGGAHKDLDRRTLLRHCVNF